MFDSADSARPNGPAAECEVLVVEPDADLRALFARQLDREPELSVRGTAETLDEGLELARQLCPDIIVFHQPETDSISALEAARLLREAVPTCQLVLVSQQEAQLEQAQEAGDLDACVMLSGATSVVRGVRRILDRPELEACA